MTTTSRRYLLVVAATLGLLALASVGAIADGDESNPPGDEPAQIVAIEPEAKDALEVLDEHRAAGDALPDDLADRMDERADFGMNPDLSRVSIGNATNSVFVIPARDHVCASLTVGEGANTICPSTDDLADGKVGPATVVLATGGIAIYGLVPDGVGSVSVQTGTSDSTEIETKDNAYYTVVPAGTRLRNVSYVGPSGPVDFRIYDPALVFEGS
jgi:hypothetical protein